MPIILALDQGTTSSRAILFTRDGKIHRPGAAGIQADLSQSGWVEHDPIRDSHLAAQLRR